MPIRATVWGENIHEQTNKDVTRIYPKGMHAQIAAVLAEDTNIVASTVTLQDLDHGMTTAKLDGTDVLLWWGHAAHEDVPEPLETVLISWFQGGEAFRSGLTYRRGAGNIFYFRPGHETYPTYHDRNVGTVLRNAVTWAYNPERHPEVLTAPNTTIDKSIEKLVERGARLDKHPH